MTKAMIEIDGHPFTRGGGNGVGHFCRRQTCGDEKEQSGEYEKAHKSHLSASFSHGLKGLPQKAHYTFRPEAKESERRS
jgi:hypothetical protein